MTHNHLYAINIIAQYLSDNNKELALAIEKELCEQVNSKIAQNYTHAQLTGSFLECVEKKYEIIKILIEALHNIVSKYPTFNKNDINLSIFQDDFTFDKKFGIIKGHIATKNLYIILYHNFITQYLYRRQQESQVVS